MPIWHWDAGSQQLADIACGLPMAILLPLSTEAVEWMVRHHDTLARQWCLPSLPLWEALHIARDKAAFTQFVVNHGLVAPFWTSLPLNDSQKLDQLSFPVLIKPRYGTGGRGIEKIETLDALLLRLRSLPNPEHYFLQSYVAGQDISCGVFCQNGRVLAAVPYTALTRRGEFGPFRSLQIIDDEKVLKTVGQLMEALRWNGLANVDLRRSKAGRIYLLEVNPRCWGNMRGLLTSRVNFADLLCRSACGEPIEKVRHEIGRSFTILDFFAELRAVIRRRAKDSYRRWPSWRESDLRFAYRDPLPHWLKFQQYLLERGKMFSRVRFLPRKEDVQNR
jgi:predicted ATP-grasp superfamily ATP-dependent carboligase